MGCEKKAGNATRVAPDIFCRAVEKKGKKRLLKIISRALRRFSFQIKIPFYSLLKLEQCRKSIGHILRQLFLRCDFNSVN